MRAALRQEHRQLRDCERDLQGEGGELHNRIVRHQRTLPARELLDQSAQMYAYQRTRNAHARAPRRAQISQRSRNHSVLHARSTARA
jgi:hypothetical protein